MGVSWNGWEEEIGRDVAMQVIQDGDQADSDVFLLYTPPPLPPNMHFNKKKSRLIFSLDLSRD